MRMGSNFIVCITHNTHAHNACRMYEAKGRHKSLFEQSNIPCNEYVCIISIHAHCRSYYKIQTRHVAVCFAHILFDSAGQ